MRIWKAKRTKRVLLAVGLLLLGLPLGARLYVHMSARGRVYSAASEVPECRVGIVLGSRVSPEGVLSPMLTDRVDTAVELYRAGKVSKLLMSGDNRFSHYNEPKRMVEYAVRHGVPAADVRADYAGRRTYDTVYRAKHIFGLDRFIIVTQPFHLDRTLFLCNKLGVDAYGVAAGRRTNLYTELRETTACLGAVVDIYLRNPRPVMGKRERI